MENQLFRELWPLLPKHEGSMYDVANFATKVFKAGVNKDNLLTYYFFINPVLGDPRFSVQFDVPANKEAFDYAQNKLTSL